MVKGAVRSLVLRVRPEFDRARLSLAGGVSLFRLPHQTDATIRTPHRITHRSSPASPHSSPRRTSASSLRSVSSLAQCIESFTAMARATFSTLPLELKARVVEMTSDQEDIWADRVKNPEARVNHVNCLSSLALVNKEFRDLAAAHQFRVSAVSLRVAYCL